VLPMTCRKLRKPWHEDMAGTGLATKSRTPVPNFDPLEIDCDQSTLYGTFTG
jgi:hypothetical protein